MTMQIDLMKYLNIFGKFALLVIVCVVVFMLVISIIDRNPGNNSRQKNKMNKPKDSV